MKKTLTLLLAIISMVQVAHSQSPRTFYEKSEPWVLLVIFLAHTVIISTMFGRLYVEYLKENKHKEIQKIDLGVFMVMANACVGILFILFFDYKEWDSETRIFLWFVRLVIVALIMNFVVKKRLNKQKKDEAKSFAEIKKKVRKTII